MRRFRYKQPVLNERNYDRMSIVLKRIQSRAKEYVLSLKDKLFHSETPAEPDPKGKRNKIVF